MSLHEQLPPLAFRRLTYVKTADLPHYGGTEALSASTSRRHKPTNGRASKPHMPVIDTAVISTADDRPIYMPVDVDVPMDIDVVMDVDVAVYAADVAMDMRS